MMVLLKALYILGIIFSQTPTIGDTTSGKILSLGLHISEVEVNLVCRYASDSGQYAVWTPYEKITTHAFFNGKPSSFKTRMYVFSEKGFYFYNPSSMIWELKNESSFGKAAWAPSTPPKIYVTHGSGITIFKNSATYVGDMSIVEEGETLSVYALEFKTGSRDSFLYVGTSKGLFLGIGTDISRVWQRLGSLEDTMTVVLFDSLSGNVYAGGPDGFYLWNGSTLELKRPGKVNDICLLDNSIFISTPQGLFTSQDGGNTWNAAFGGFFNDLDVALLLPLADTLYAAVNDSGVFKVIRDFPTPVLLREGLLPFRKLGGFKFLSLDYQRYVANSPTIYLGTEMGPFILENGRWKLFAGWASEPGNLLGYNVSSSMVDSMLVSLVPIFDSLKTFQEIKSHLEDSLGLEFPDADDYDGIHIVVFPFHEVASDPTQGYFPDIIPVYGYFNIDFYEDSLVTLKEAIHIEPLNYLVLGENAGDISVQKAFLSYLIHRVAFHATKPQESNYVITGLSIASAFFSGETTLAEGVVPDAWPSTPAYLLKFRENPNRSLTMISFSHPSTPEPAEIDREKLGLFFIYLLERYGWNSFNAILSNTTLTGLNAISYYLESQGSTFNEFLKDWVIANIVDDPATYGYKSLDIRVGTKSFTEAPTIDSQRVYSGLYYVFEPVDTLIHPIRIEADDDASLTYYRVVYNEQDEVMSVEPLIYDTLRNFYKGNSGENKEVYISISFTPSEFWIATSMGDSTPPEPSFVVLQNPGVDNVLDFYVWDDERCYLDVKEEGSQMVIYPEGTEPDSGIKISIEDIFSSGTYSIYYGNTTFQDQGTFIFSAWAQDIVGNDAYGTPYTLSIFQFTSEGGTFTAFDGELLIELPENAIAGTHMVLVNRISEEEMKNSGLLPEDLEAGVSPVYVIGRRGFVLLKPVTLVITHPSLKNEETSVFQYEPSTGWIPLEGSIDRESGVGRVKASRLGWFQVRAGASSYTEKVFLSLPNGNLVKNGNMNIVFGLPNASHVVLKAYNSSGQMVRTLIDKELPRGIHKIKWNGCGEKGRSLGQGVYFLRLDTNWGDKITQRFIILK